jgi:serine protease Do
MMSNRSRPALLLCASALIVASGCGGGDRVQAQSRGNASNQVREQLGPVPALLDTASASRLSGAFRGAAERALPAVVQIQVTLQRERPTTSSQRFQLPFPFPGLPEDDDPRRSQGMGSGFIFDPRGYILTNNHVIAGASSVRVTMVDGREYDAKVIGADRDTDIGVIKIEPRRGEQLVAAQIGSSDLLRVGDWVLALGNPLGLNFTVTAGIVSAKSRSIDIIDSPNRTALEAFIQTDAAINRGNSGGPLVDLLGRVVGINSAIQSPTGYYTGAGFAIPIDLARKVAQDLIEFGVVHRPRLGVEVSGITEADAEIYKLPAVSGAEIVSVQEGTPAARAGLQLGDVVVNVDGKPVRTQSVFMEELAKKRPGDTVRLEYIRYGRRLQADVKLSEFQPIQPERVRTERPVETSSVLGFRWGTAPQQCGFSRASGVYVVEIDRYSAAAQANIAPCAQILRINGQAVNSSQDIERVARSLKPGDTVSLVLRETDENDRAQERIRNFRLAR